ncbi:helix-turn-helix domain-containing protein [Mesobacillus zeae]|uniref:XRE family transcriptional regulator n=1 Tax=Mesobacillus zeae TaxID=1917180 RepID=A0A398BH48_9BACI|nr:helix-turn-helix transcriptional regulator [Mesobacillus zeae]RID88924.1 XRE family transcriptional regulator [Mesobacillus zeae]
MFGLGKPRSEFGRWLDRNGITQAEVARRAKVSAMTLTRLCGEKGYTPKIATWVRIERALKAMGYDVDANKFFDM